MPNDMLLYRKLEVLLRSEHGKLKLRPVGGYTFSADTHWVPVAGVEFPLAWRSYPIVFVSEERADGRRKMTPVALLGLSAGKNDFVLSDSSWRANTYIPAFVRRYPFIFSTERGAQDELLVCFDAAFEGFSEQSGIPLFNEDGTDSDLLRKSVAYMAYFNEEIKRTQEFCDLLLHYNVFAERTLTIRNDNGDTFQVPGFHVIDQDQLTGLIDSRLELLHRKGFLKWIFAHQMSLSSLSLLFNLHLEAKQPRAAQDVPEELGVSA